MIMGITGACRREELCNIQMNDIQNHGTMFLVTIPKTKTGISRSFTVMNEFYTVCKKYIQMRPSNVKTNRLFLQYHRGRCTTQPIGINNFGAMPKKVAEFLNLSNPEMYTGHCFRRTSTTLLAEAGADITTLKRHGGWKSNSVAEGYIEASINNKKKSESK